MARDAIRTPRHKTTKQRRSKVTNNFSNKNSKGRNNSKFPNHITKEGGRDKNNPKSKKQNVIPEENLTKTSFTSKILYADRVEESLDSIMPFVAVLAFLYINS